MWRLAQRGNEYKMILHCLESLYHFQKAFLIYQEHRFYCSLYCYVYTLQANKDKNQFYPTLHSTIVHVRLIIELELHFDGLKCQQRMFQ